MKFAPDVLLEIVDIVRIGLSEGKDISKMFRALDVRVDEQTSSVCLTDEYRKNKEIK